MAEIFISYAREDELRARQLAVALKERGWDVWWDHSLLHGADFEREIEREVRNASCVLMLWSRNAEESTWVRNEARVAGERDVLIPVLIEERPLSMAHLHRQYARLIDWGPGRESEEFERLNAAIARLVERAPKVEAPPPRPPPAPPFPRPSPARTPRLPQPSDPGRLVGCLIAVTVILLAAIFTAEMCSNVEGPAAMPASLVEGMKAVGWISLGLGGEKCTGFRIAPGAAVTGFSCVDPEALDMLPSYFMRLDEPQNAVDGVEQDETMGYALLRLKERTPRAFIPRRMRVARVGETAMILLPTSAISCTVRSVTPKQIQYDCATKDTDRGAPVMSADGAYLLGMHTAPRNAIPASVFAPAALKSWALAAPAR